VAKKILVVDDDKVIQQLLIVNLELEGYEVVTASDGAAAIERVSSEKPDLVILDIMMPKFDGWEVCRRIKANPKTAEVPVIFVSARAQELDVRRGYELGVGAYVTKPFDPVELLDIIKRVLKGERLLPSDT
jgi:DNA-binding response OmpR family regulator